MQIQLRPVTYKWIRLSIILNMAYIFSRYLKMIFFSMLRLSISLTVIKAFLRSFDIFLTSASLSSRKASSFLSRIFSFSSFDASELSSKRFTRRSSASTSLVLNIFMKSASAYAGCVAGALKKEEYLSAIQESGLEKVQVVEEKTFDKSLLVEAAETGSFDDPGITVDEAIDTAAKIVSIGVSASKPH